MKKCNCGKDMEDWMTVCKDCYGKQLDKKGDPRQNSIERQVATKCVAQLFQGEGNSRNIDEEVLTNAFNIFLKLIRG